MATATKAKKSSGSKVEAMRAQREASIKPHGGAFDFEKFQAELAEAKKAADARYLEDQKRVLAPVLKLIEDTDAQIEELQTKRDELQRHVDRILGTKTAKRRGRGTSAARASGVASSLDVDDEAVLKAIGGGEEFATSRGDTAKKLGVEADANLSKVLKRLEAEKKIKRIGEAKGTKYFRI